MLIPEHIFQEDSQGCGLACVAMVAGCSYEEVRQLVTNGGYYDLHRVGIPQASLYQLLAHFGFSCVPVSAFDQISQRRRQAWPVAPFAPVHIARVQDGRAGHYVVITAEGAVLDPYIHSEKTSLAEYEVVHSLIGLFRIDSLSLVQGIGCEPLAATESAASQRYVPAPPKHEHAALLAMLTGIPLVDVIVAIEEAKLSKRAWYSRDFVSMVRQLGFASPERFVPFDAETPHAALLRYGPSKERLQLETQLMFAKSGDETKKARTWWNAHVYHAGTMYCAGSGYLPLQEWLSYNTTFRITSMLPVWPVK